MRQTATPGHSGQIKLPAVTQFIKYADNHFWIVAVLNLVILCIFSLSHGSLITGLILLAPVNLAHQGMIAIMHLLGIGLDVNSMIMAANVLAALVVLPCLVALTHRRVYAALAQSSA